MRHDQCLPSSIFTTSTRASWILDSCRAILRPRAERGSLRFHDACFASADRESGFRGGRFLPQLVPCFHRATTCSTTEPLTPLSRPRFVDGACARIESSRTPRPLLPCLREKNTAPTIRDAFHRRVIPPAPPFREIGRTLDRFSRLCRRDFGLRRSFARRGFGAAHAAPLRPDALGPRSRSHRPRVTEGEVTTLL